MPVKYVFVTGGVVSGLGKGITAASLGRLLKARGFSVTMQKFDPYINIDPGTMNPIQHGEVFVTDDGAETDLDLGHYERFIDENLNKNSNVTTGKVYWSVLQKERRGDFGGGTVQVIPHITNEIKSRFFRDFSTKDTKIAIIEVGGTVGDIESQPFLEAIRQFQHEVGRENAILIHVTLIPYLKASGEMKTKPTQASVKELQGMGIQPDILVCRTEHPLEPGIKDKIALFCNVPKSHVLQNLDVEILYDAPLAMEEEHLAQVACECLQLECPEPDLDEWRAMCKAWKNPQKKVTVALVGKYIQLHDAYISVVEALKHGGVYNSADVTIKWVDSELVTEENAAALLTDCDAVLDGLDNIQSRQILANACERAGIPLIYGAVNGWVAQAAISCPGDHLIDLLYPDGAALKNKSVLSFTPALCASMQVSLCVKFLTDRPVRTGTLYFFDLLNQEFEVIPMT